MLSLRIMAMEAFQVFPAVENEVDLVAVLWAFQAEDCSASQASLVYRASVQ